MSRVYPILRKMHGQKPGIRIEVAADSMRVGKTTAIQVLATGLRQKGERVTESYEDWQHNPYLKKSYSNPEKNFLASQKWFVHRKWEQIQDGGEGIFIQDVTPEMDYCYALTSYRLGRMSQTDFQTYAQYVAQLDWSRAPAPTLLLYLKVSNRELLKRAEASKRSFETVEPTYFLTMKKTNRGWLNAARGKYPILEIDTDHLDFAHDDKAKEILIAQVRQAL